MTQFSIDQTREEDPKKDIRFMKEALRQAKKAFALGEVPIGCVIVRREKTEDGQVTERIIARGYNRRNTDKNVLSHAETNAMRKATKVTGDWRLEDCTLYVTLEPCQMCAGAIVQARVKRVVVACMNPKAGCAGSIINLLQMAQFNHQVDLTTGVMAEECSQLLSRFFQELRIRNRAAIPAKTDPDKTDPAAAGPSEEQKKSRKEEKRGQTYTAPTVGHGRRKKMVHKQYKVILWDVDGTLLNFLAAEKAALQKCFLHYGLGQLTEEQIARYSAINRRYWEALERGEITKQEVLVGRYREFMAGEGMDSSLAEKINAMYQVSLGDTCVFQDDAYHILERLKGHVLQYAVTNGTETAQTRKLANSGLDQLFDGVFISDRIGYEKPSAEFFDAVWKEFGPQLASGELNKEDFLIVGDSLTSDIRGGNNAGIDTCWYNPQGKQNDKGVHVDYEINDLHQVWPISGVRFKK